MLITRIFFTIVWLQNSFAFGNTIPRTELEWLDVAFSHRIEEMSGGGIVDRTFLIVSDEPTDTAILSTPLPWGENKKPLLNKKPERFYLKPWLEIKEFQTLGVKKFDLEGLAVCPQTIYLANEASNDILQVSRETKKISIFSMRYDKNKLQVGGANAGIEGVAVDCDKGILYVAKEREPRAIIAFALADGRVLKESSPLASNRAGQKVIDPKTGDGLISINDDFADLAFDSGFLYALERNTKEIVKLDPIDLIPISRVSFLSQDQGLYDTGEPYGTAEVLILKGDEIFIGFDNNQSLLSARAQERFSIAGRHGAIFRFKRPQGF